MTGAELIERIVDDYYAADLPEDPAARATVLRDLVEREWRSLSRPDRIALATDLDHDHLAAFAERAPHLSDEEAEELDEQAMDGLVDVARREIPELAW
jgi:hypothetical protein